jgi:hypothetical protein
VRKPCHATGRWFELRFSTSLRQGEGRRQDLVSLVKRK